MSDFSLEMDARKASSGAPPQARPSRRRTGGRWALLAATVLVVGGAGYAVVGHGGQPHPAAAMPAPQVTVSTPLARSLSPRTGFLGQFSAVDAVEIRAQVGGTLTEIHFTDGQTVHKGDLLFVIDPRPYQIRLEQAVAQVQSAQSRLELAQAELWRAQQLKKVDFGTGQNVDQRSADLRADQASLDLAKAAVRDAQLDLEYSRVTAPFTGRISSHRVSVGNLVSGSRGGTSATTLLTTIVSLDPIYLDFDMSEADYLAFQRGQKTSGSRADRVDISVGDTGVYDVHGTLDFVDNALDRASGTIHARATVPNTNLVLTPGEFARLRLEVGTPQAAMLVPDAAIVPDQSQQMVMTVAADGSVVPKIVTTGGMRGGLRVVTSGLTTSDRVIVNGLMHALPGSKVQPQPGSFAYDAADDSQR